jgi:hypothetical protein
LHEYEEAVGLAAVKPDDGSEVLKLFRGEVIDFPSHFSIDVSGIDHEDMIFMINRVGKSTLTPSLSHWEREFCSELIKGCFRVGQQIFIFDSDDPDALRL